MMEEKTTFCAGSADYSYTGFIMLPQFFSKIKRRQLLIHSFCIIKVVIIENRYDPILLDESFILKLNLFSQFN